jgi:hypothetical protein
MFNFLRWFSGISLILICVASYFLSDYFKEVASEDLEYLVERNNTALAQGYVNSVWTWYRDQHPRKPLRQLFKMDPKIWHKFKEFREFRRDTLKYFEAMPVMHITIYTPDGELILTNLKDLPSDFIPKNDQERHTFERAKAGEVGSSVQENIAFTRPDGQNISGTLVQTFVPIIPDSYVPAVADQEVPPAQAVIQLDYDVTSQWNKVQSFQMIAAGGIVAIFFSLIAILMFSSAQAEKMIARQHEINLE